MTNVSRIYRFPDVILNLRFVSYLLYKDLAFCYVFKLFTCFLTLVISTDTLELNFDVFKHVLLSGLLNHLTVLC